jgi:SagB-type dehydrogenase family enzyme
VTTATVLTVDGIPDELRGHWMTGTTGDRPSSAATLRRYHEATKHFPHRPSASPYGLEWANQPSPLKRYPGLEPERPPHELERLLRIGAGVHPRRRDPHFRTFMSAGALHPVELYVATGSGLAHFDPGEGTLRPLREDDPRAALAAAAAAPELADAAVVLALGGILWRTAWKYGARGWRHVFWDAGAMLANLLALAEKAGREPRLVVAFADRAIAEVLGIEPPREQPVALFAAGRGERAAGAGRLSPVEHHSPLLSPRERRFEDAEEAEEASSLVSADAVRAWREAAREFGDRTGAGEPPGPLEEVILRRGSTREFTLERLASENLATVLTWACAPVRGDLPPLCTTFVVAHAVEGLAPGVHRFEPPDRFELIHGRASRRATAHACLDQPHGGSSAATLFLTADLDRALTALGGRGYRAAQLDAGIRAGRTSLGAYARGIGATGLTFYDDEVRAYLDTDTEPMMCVAVGGDARRPGLRRTAPSG